MKLACGRCEQPFDEAELHEVEPGQPAICKKCSRKLYRLCKACGKRTLKADQEDYHGDRCFWVCRPCAQRMDEKDKNLRPADLSNPAGLRHFRVVGPMTDTACVQCKTWLGRTLAYDELPLIGWGPHGFHRRCRCSLQPIRPEWIGLSPGNISRTGPYERLAQSHDADESMPRLSWREYIRLPEAKRLGLARLGLRIGM